MPSSIAALVQDVVPGFRYRLTMTVRIVDPTDKHPALVRFVFLDGADAPLPGGVAGDDYLNSDIYGAYRYIGRPGKAGQVEVDSTFAVPEGCTRVELELHLWRAGAVQVKRAMRLALEDPADAEAIADLRIADKVIATSTHEIRAGESYDLAFAFDGPPLEERGVIAALRFFDAAGGRVPAPPNLPFSELAGAFRYVEPQAEPMLGAISLAAPAGAARMQIRLLGWKHNRSWQLTDQRLTWLGSDQMVAASGQIDLPQEEAPLAVHARVLAAGGSSTTLGALQLIFEDAAGTPLMTQGGNLSRSDRFVNHIPLRAPLPHMVAPDGSFSVVHAFVPPAGATRMGWRLLDPEHGWHLAAPVPPALHLYDPDPRAQITALREAARPQDPAVPPDLRGSLYSAFPDSSLWQATALGQMHLLGEVMQAVTPGDWVAISGRLDRVPRQLVICPLYFDAEAKLLPDAVGPGCARSGTLPPGRDVPLDGQGFRACMMAPPEAAWAAFHLMASAEDPAPPTLERLAVAPADPETVCDGMDPALLSEAQLRAAVQLAEATGQLPLLRDACRALALLRPDQPSFAGRAAQLDRELAPLDPDWLPLLFAASEADTGTAPRKGEISVLYVARATDTAVPGALRDLARGGVRVALWRPMVTSPAGLPDPAASPPPDGLHEDLEDGVRVLSSRAAGVDPAQMGASVRVTFDAALAQRAAAGAGADVLHAAGGMEAMLCALAVARAQGAALVCELEALPVAQTLLARLQAAQVLRCLTAADAVLAPAGLHEPLRARGISPGALVALSPDPATQAQSHAQAHAVARTNRQETR